MTWRADLVQGIIFPSGSSQIDAQEAFERGLEIKPDGYQGPGAALNGLSFANAVINDKQIIVQSQVGRIDLTLARAATQHLMTEPPRLDDTKGAVAEVAGWCSRISTRLQPPPSRIALVCNMSINCETEERASEILQDKTGGVWFPKSAVDSLYQINVRKSFANSDGDMNRILQWSAGLASLKSLAVGQFMGSVVPAVHKTIPIISFKVDINTVPEYALRGATDSLFAEMKEEMVQIIDRGLDALR